MAIIKCPECGNQVSDKAATCPHCGVAIAGTIAQPKKTSGGNKGNDGKKGRKKSIALWTIAFLIALAAVIAGVYVYKSAESENEMDAYENAMSSTEAAVLQNFLDVYKDAPAEHKDSIAAHLERLKRVDLEWTNAVVSNSRIALERFAKMYPNSVHVVEAELKIDSLDWAAARRDSTAESFQKYISMHPDGHHIDEAHEAFEKIDRQTLSDSETTMISQMFSSFFHALSMKDEGELTLHLDNIMTSFLHRSNATKADVIQYMNRLYEPADINMMSFRVNNDMKIEKKETAVGEFDYDVTFSVDQMIDRDDPQLESFVSYKVMAKVSMEGKITELNMKKVVQ